MLRSDLAEVGACSAHPGQVRAPAATSLRSVTWCVGLLGMQSSPPMPVGCARGQVTHSCGGAGDRPLQLRVEQHAHCVFAGLIGAMARSPRRVG